MSTRSTTGHIVGDIRAHRRGLAADAWQDFRTHWPMHVLHLLLDIGAGTLLGVALGLSLFLWALERLA